MPGWHIGVIGDVELADACSLDERQEIAVASAFGEPSGPVTMGRIGDVRITLLARTGAGWRLPSGEANHRANIDVLKRCGVTDVVAASSVRSLRDDEAAGGVVIVDQIIDHSAHAASYFGAGFAAQVDLADPVCPRLSALALAAAEAAGQSARGNGCYLATAGPHFPTRAECELYRTWGADVVGMSAMPEAGLAREAELPYALIGLVGDRLETAGCIAAILRELVANLPGEREPSPIDRALDSAIITPPEAWERRVAARLDAVAGRILRERRPDWFQANDASGLQ